MRNMSEIKKCEGCGSNVTVHSKEEKMKKWITAIKYWFLIIWLSFKWMFRICLGDQVWYKGKKYCVLNGVRENSWRLSNLDNGDDGWVLRKECKKVKSYKNYLHSFTSGYHFYMTSWYDIWKRNGIQNWMRGCRIWGNH
jgi:hypothetical protein